jgi:hypothetical protein
MCSTHSLTSALDGVVLSDSYPGHFTPRERAPSLHCIGDWMGPRAGLDTVSKRKTPSSGRDSNPDHPVVQPVVSRYTGGSLLLATVGPTQNPIQ